MLEPEPEPEPEVEEPPRVSCAPASWTWSPRATASCGSDGLTRSAEDPYVSRTLVRRYRPAARARRSPGRVRARRRGSASRGRDGRDGRGATGMPSARRPSASTTCRSQRPSRPLRARRRADAFAVAHGGIVVAAGKRSARAWSPGRPARARHTCCARWRAGWSAARSALIVALSTCAPRRCRNGRLSEEVEVRAAAERPAATRAGGARRACARARASAWRSRARTWSWCSTRSAGWPAPTGSRAARRAATGRRRSCWRSRAPSAGSRRRATPVRDR